MCRKGGERCDAEGVGFRGCGLGFRIRGLVKSCSDVCVGAKGGGHTQESCSVEALRGPSLGSVMRPLPSPHPYPTSECSS